MSFLGIGFLAAIPLIAAPLLLHLFDRRRNVQIEWGAMQFVTAAASRRSRARRLRNWLLLLLRTFAIAALVFALARPMVSGGWLGDDHRSETIVILDNSMSTTRRLNDQSIIDRIIQKAIDDVNRLVAGDRLRLMTTSPYPVWLQSSSVRVDQRSRGGLVQSLAETKANLGKGDFLASLLTAVQSEPHPTVSHRRIVVISDRQATGWAWEDRQGWKRFADALSDASISTELVLLDVSDDSSASVPAAVQNVAIDRIETRRTLVGIDEPFTLSAIVHNYAARTTVGRSLTWHVDGLPIFSGQVESIDSGDFQEATWTHSFSSPGVYRIGCRLGGSDSLSADDATYIVVEVVDEIPVAIVESSIRRADLQQDSYFVAAALGWLGDRPMSGRSVYAPTIVSPAELGGIGLGRFRAVVIPNLVEIEDEAMTMLRDFVTDGGGLWAGLGARTDVDAFNDGWFDGGNGLSPLALDRIVDERPRRHADSDDEPPDAVPATRINPFDAGHPATVQLADNEQLDIADVVIDRRFRFVSDDFANETSVLLSLSNGAPLAVEKLYGRGRVIVQTVPMQMQWSSLARSQAFVVMVRDWIAYLCEPGATQFNLSPGDPIELRFPGDDATTAVLTTPADESIELASEGFGDEAMFRTSRTRLPGEYALEIGLAGDRIPFQVNRDPQESDLTPLSETQRRERDAIFTAVKQRDNEPAASTAPTSADPLWPYLLMALVGAITAELLLSGVMARERFGVATATDPTEHDFGRTVGLRATIGDRSGWSPASLETTPNDEPLNRSSVGEVVR